MVWALCSHPQGKSLHRRLLPDSIQFRSVAARACFAGSVAECKLQTRPRAASRSVESSPRGDASDNDDDWQLLQDELAAPPTATRPRSMVDDDDFWTFCLPLTSPPICQWQEQHVEDGEEEWLERYQNLATRNRMFSMMLPPSGASPQVGSRDRYCWFHRLFV